MAQALGEVLDGVDRLRTWTVERLPIDRAVETHRRTQRGDAGEFVGELTEQRVHLRGVARALRLQLATELALGLGASHDRVDLPLGPADHGVRRRGIYADLEVGIVGEHTRDVVGAVLHQGHQADVVAGQTRLTLAHQPRALADDTGRVFQRQSATDIGRRRLSHRMRHQHTGLRAVVAQQLGESDLDREDADLRSLDPVGLLVIGEYVDDRVPELVLHVAVDLVKGRGEHRVLEVELLGHLAMLRTEPGQQPNHRRGIGCVASEHERIVLALRHCAHSAHSLVVVVRHDHRAAAAVVTVRQRPTDVGEWGRAPGLGIDPIGHVAGTLAASRREETGDDQRHDPALDRTRRVLGDRIGRGDHGFACIRRGVREQPGCGLLGVGQVVVVGIKAQVGAIERGVPEVGAVEIGGRVLRVTDGCGDRVDEVAGQHFADHDVGVGPAEAVAGHTRDRRPTVARPIGRLGDHPQSGGLELDVRIGAGVVQRRRQLVVLHRQHELDEPCRTRRRLEVAEVRLGGAE